MVGAIATSDYRLPEASPIANLLQKVQKTQIIFVDENNQFCSTINLAVFDLAFRTALIPQPLLSSEEKGSRIESPSPFWARDLG